MLYDFPVSSSEDYDIINLMISHSDSDNDIVSLIILINDSDNENIILKIKS